MHESQFETERLNKVLSMRIEISDIQLFTLLKEKVGEREATSLIDYVKQETSSYFAKTKELLSKDIASLQIRIDGLFGNVDVKFLGIDERFRIIDEKFKSQEQSFAYKILESKNEMMKAMYITSFIQIISIIGGIMASVKFMR